MKILNIQYVDSVGVLATLVYKYIGNGEGKINLTALKFYDNFIFPVSKFFDLIFNKYTIIFGGSANYTIVFLLALSSNITT